METIKKIVKSNNVVLFLLLILVVAFFGTLNPAFLRAVNLVQYINNGVVLGFLTLGLSATIITGNFDLSIGSILGFGTVIMALSLNNGVSLPLALVIGFLTILILGAFNGFIVGFLRVPGMLATLGTSSLIYGISLVLTGGQAIGSYTPEYEFFGKSEIGTLPFGLILLIIIFLLSVLLLEYTSWGRKLYLIGSAPTAARFSGISYPKEVLLAYIYSALMCFFGALILGSHMASGRADVGEPYVLQAVTAAVFGGIDIKGGSGSPVGAILGVMIFTLLTSGFTIIDISQFYKQVVTGVLLIVVLIIRNYRLIFNKS